MYQIRKSFRFEAAHQLETAVTKACSDCIHGHSYKVEMYLLASKLDLMDMVVDFAVLKPFKRRVMEAWDHGLLLHENKRKWIEPMIDAGVLKEEKVHFFEFNPTAEMLAATLLTNLREFIHEEGLHGKVIVYAVHVQETETGEAIAMNPELLP